MRKHIAEAIQKAGDRAPAGFPGSRIAWQGIHLQLVYREASTYYHHGRNYNPAEFTLWSTHRIGEEPEAAVAVRRPFNEPKRMDPALRGAGEFHLLISQLTKADDQIKAGWIAWQAEARAADLAEEAGLRAQHEARVAQRRLEKAAPQLLAELKLAVRMIKIATPGADTASMEALIAQVEGG